MATITEERLNEVRMSRAAWALKYPDHCPACEGAGAFTRCCGEECEGEECEDCQGRHPVCPRCKAPGVSIFAPGLCPACGWSYGAADAVMPSGELLWRAASEAEWAACIAAGGFIDPFADEAA